MCRSYDRWGKFDGFRKYHALSLNGNSKIINAVKRQRNLGLCVRDYTNPKNLGFQGSKMAAKRENPKTKNRKPRPPIRRHNKVWVVYGDSSVSICGGSRGSDHFACLTGSHMTFSLIFFPVLFSRISPSTFFPYYFALHIKSYSPYFNIILAHTEL